MVPDVLLERLAACQRLYDRYQHCFQLSKQRLSGSQRPFEISEMYVFGKFHSFCRRMDQIKTMVNVIKELSVLQESHIEGIEVLANRFKHITNAAKKKPYNPLDHRKTEFNTDFVEFQRQVTELEEQLCVFMASSFTKVKSLMQTMQLLLRYICSVVC